MRGNSPPAPPGSTLPTHVAGKVDDLHQIVYGRCVAAAREAGYVDRNLLRAKCFLGWNLQSVYLARLEREGVIGPEGEEGRHPLLSQEKPL